MGDQLMNIILAAVFALLGLSLFVYLYFDHKK